ncbi:hypothetical protein ACFXP7_11330 [Microbacterium sp. P06]|uniref:hypothetical protein n=1 Tax=unclassified Microbacterium TaxID=2609290 RepID=UPI00374639C0
MRRTPILATVALALVLAGCSSPAAPEAEQTEMSSPSATATTTTPTAAGDVQQGDGYSYTAPEGWGIPEGQEKPAGVDTIAADLEDTDGFADNVNVVLSPSGEVTTEQVETLGVQELEGGGATGVEVLDRVEIAGVESSHLTALLSSEGTEYRIEQYYPTNAGQTYVVTFTFNDTVDEADRDALAQSVLATWEWA